MVQWFIFKYGGGGHHHHHNRSSTAEAASIRGQREGGGDVNMQCSSTVCRGAKYPPSTTAAKKEGEGEQMLRSSYTQR